MEKNYEEIEACSPEGARNICDSDGAVSLTVDKNVIEGESSWQLWYEDSVSVSVEQDGISGEYDFGFEAYPSAEYEELVSDFTFLQDTYENVNPGEKITLDVKGFTVNCIPVTYNTDYGIQAEYSMWTDVEGVVVSCGFYNSRRMEFLSVIGSASSKGDDVTITDEKSGDQETVTVIYQNDGSVKLISSDGIEAQLQRCDKEDFIDLVSGMEETVDSLYNLF